MQLVDQLVMQPVLGYKKASQCVYQLIITPDYPEII